jgi:hypothetical protein
LKGHPAVKRIFLTLTIVSNTLLLAAFVLGLAIREPQSKMMSYHLLVSVLAMIFAALVHATLLTYFMGTGRWMEEIRVAYQLDLNRNEEGRQLKNRTIPTMTVCLIILIVNIPLGAKASASVHLAFAALTIVVNALVNVQEFRAIRRNGELIAEMIDEVRRIREARGLPV